MHAGSLAVSEITSYLLYSALYSLSTILSECANTKYEVYAQHSALKNCTFC